jgi:predicted RNA binding protein YcfA (HicA-like mRNA interferase family)
LEKHGFSFNSQRGSHAKYRKIVGKKCLTVIVPMKKREMSCGTFLSILRQADLSEKDFKNN